jgi:hypothetical protein
MSWVRFRSGGFDDQVDALSLAFAKLWGTGADKD